VTLPASEQGVSQLGELDMKPAGLGSERDLQTASSCHRHGGRAT
jgi:hypothetical protein